MALDKIFEDYLEKELAQPSSDVFHYTKKTKKILKSKYLKLSSHKKLNKNGNGELKVGIKLIKNELKKRNINEKKFNEYIDKAYMVYIASFCDTNNLDYARKKYGKGCIEFKNNFLIKFIKNQSIALFGYVIYEHHKQKQIISTMFDLYEKNPSSETILFTWLSIVILFFKEKKHHSDQECRIVTAEIKSPRSSGRTLTPKCPKKIEFHRNEINLITLKNYTNS